VVTVDGAVQQAGQYPVAGPMTLIQTIALARGTTEDANARRVAVFRTIGGQRQAAAFDLTAIRRGEAKDPQIYPGDIVVVDGSSIKAAQKQIFQTFPFLSIFRPF
jgi:polysaccharide export outer membrane protein